MDIIVKSPHYLKVCSDNAREHMALWEDLLEDFSQLLGIVLVVAAEVIEESPKADLHRQRPCSGVLHLDVHSYPLKRYAIVAIPLTCTCILQKTWYVMKAG